ncbi:MAG: pyridoxal-phosphate dependent enzyme [Candidatus Latescibacteria bacterium]|nr:pyridoxal-phosphate dependent enzyme [Candidatus Latescibacterota bacterium]
MNCGICAGPLGFHYSYDDVTWDDRFEGSMWRYWPLLPVDAPEGAVTLGEGGTPLLPAQSFNGRQVYLKDETRNPTGSHKDRSLSVAITHAKAVGADVSVIVSTGSAGISNAALAARAGMRSAVVMTEGTPPERLYPMFEVKAQIDPIVEGVISVCRERGLYLSTTSRNSNPYQCEGNKTIAYEIVEELGGAPDWVVVPVGGGGTISGIWRGFRDCHALGLIDSLPRMIGVVPRDYNALEVAEYDWVYPAGILRPVGTAHDRSAGATSDRWLRGCELLYFRARSRGRPPRHIGRGLGLAGFQPLAREREFEG